MDKNNHETQRQKMRADRLKFQACIYTPQVPRQGLQEYVPTSGPQVPVAAEGECIASPPVLPLDFTPGQEWQALIRSSSKRQGAETGKIRLDTLIQAIAESGQEMLPLLRTLREKAAADPRLSEVVTALQDRLDNEAPPLGPSLAPREKEVLELAARGQSNADIARKLNLRTITVAKALSRAYRKLDARNRTDAVHKWMLRSRSGSHSSPQL